MILIGIGAGLGFPSLMTLAMSGVSESDSGLASGLVNTSVQVGGAIGLAILATFATERTEGLLADGEPAAEALNSGPPLASRWANRCSRRQPRGLLRQPRGFEGFTLAAKERPPGRLPVSQHSGLPHRLLDRDAAQRPGHAETHDTPVARSANVEQLPVHVLESAANRIPPGTNARVTRKTVPSASATIDVNSTSWAISARNASISPEFSAP
jgi:hypothetical protein